MTPPSCNPLSLATPNNSTMLYWPTIGQTRYRQIAYYWTVTKRKIGPLEGYAWGNSTADVCVCVCVCVFSEMGVGEEQS